MPLNSCSAERLPRRAVRKYKSNRIPRPLRQRILSKATLICCELRVSQSTHGGVAWWSRDWTADRVRIRRGASGQARCVANERAWAGNWMSELRANNGIPGASRSDSESALTFVHQRRVKRELLDEHR